MLAPVRISVPAPDLVTAVGEPPALKFLITEFSVNVPESVRITISPPAAVGSRMPSLKTPPFDNSPFTLRTLPAVIVKLLLPSFSVLTAAVVCAVMAPEIETLLVSSTLPRVAAPAMAAGAFVSVP